MSDNVAGGAQSPYGEPVDGEDRAALESELRALDSEARELSQRALISPGMDGHLSAQLEELDERRDAVRRRLGRPTRAQAKGSIWGWVILLGFVVAVVAVLGAMAQ